MFSTARVKIFLFTLATKSSATFSQALLVKKFLITFLGLLWYKFFFRNLQKFLLLHHQHSKENIVFKIKLQIFLPFLLSNTKTTKAMILTMGHLFCCHPYCAPLVDIPSHLSVLTSRGNSEHVSVLANTPVGWSVGHPLTSPQLILIPTP